MKTGRYLLPGVAAIMLAAGDGNAQNRLIPPVPVQQMGYPIGMRPAYPMGVPMYGSYGMGGTSVSGAIYWTPQPSAPKAEKPKVPKRDKDEVKVENVKNMILKYFDQRSSDYGAPLQFGTNMNMYGYLADIFITKQRAGEDGYTQGTVIKFKRKFKGANFGAYDKEDPKKFRQILESNGIAFIYVDDPEDLMKNSDAFFAKLTSLLAEDNTVSQTRRYVKKFEDEGWDGHSVTYSMDDSLQKKVAQKKKK